MRPGFWLLAPLPLDCAPPIEVCDELAMNVQLPPVVITRPRAQAAALAERVAALGRTAVVFPLLEILPLADPAPLRTALQALDSYALVVFVSPNAIHAALAEIEAWPHDVLLAVVGEGSRRALARHGITAANATIVQPSNPIREDSEGLLEALDLTALRGRRALIVRGEHGRELLSDALRAAQVEVTQVAAYRRIAPQLDQAGWAQLQSLLESGADWIITSSEALRFLVQFAAQLEGEAGVVKMQQQRLIVPHFRIAETARSLGFSNLTLTASGDEALLGALQFAP
jgi:uroporphyrinogen-III synthase